MARHITYRDGNKTDEEGFSRLARVVTSGAVLSGQVEQTSPVSLAVKVNTGDFIIEDSTKTYHGWSDTDETVSLTTADPSNPRLDSIVAYIDKSLVETTNANSPNGLVFEVVDGTPAASPVAPSGSTIQTQIGASNPYIVIADVEVAAAGTSVTDSDITDQRSLLKTGIVPADRSVLAGAIDLKPVAYTPTITPAAGMTYTGITTECFYIDLGDVYYLSLSVDGTTGGTAGSRIDMSLPFNTRYSSEQGIGGIVRDGVSVGGAGMVFDNATTILTRKSDAANFGLGSGRSIHLAGILIKQ